MLRPGDRNLLLESLRPPAGYRLDRAIGTTFTLDLLSLLTTPLAFTFFDWEDQEGRPAADPLALLEAVRRHASRIHLFCQVGEIHVPPPDKPLLTYLEDSVIQVRAPRGGVFHPKVWALRFQAADEPVRYRLVCLTRNLTFSRSWDTVLVLDGNVSNRRNAFFRNHALGDFIEGLPALATRTVDSEIGNAVAEIAREIRRVDFELPEGFSDLQFWPLGMRGKQHFPFPKNGAGFLVMSPFVGAGFLERFSARSKIAHLVSRPETVGKLPVESLAEVGEVWSLAAGADLDSNEGLDEARDDGADEPEASQLAGLHAKLYIQDDGWNARIWTGSANATEAAFGRNVEFLVELRGRKKRCGIDALLGDEEKLDGLRSLLVKFDAEATAQDPPDDETVARRAVAATKKAIIAADFEVQVTAIEGDRFSLALTPTHAMSDSSEARIEAWPVTLPATSALELLVQQRSPSTLFDDLSIGAITAFWAFRVTCQTDGDKAEDRFVLRLPLRGAPEGRKERVMRDLLTDRDQVMRLLLLLLSQEGLRVADLAGIGAGSWNGAGLFGGLGQASLLEALLRGLHSDSAALDHVTKLVRDLEATEEGRSLLPDGFDQIWAPLRRVHEERRRR